MMNMPSGKLAIEETLAQKIDASIKHQVTDRRGLMKNLLDYLWSTGEYFSWMGVYTNLNKTDMKESFFDEQGIKVTNTHFTQMGDVWKSQI